MGLMNCACVFQWAWGGPVAGNCFAFHMVMLLELSWALNSGFATRGNVKTILEKKKLIFDSRISP